MLSTRQRIKKKAFIEMGSKNYKKAVLAIIISAFGFSLMNLFVKMAGDLPTMQKCFFRNFVAAVFTFFFLIVNKKSFIPKKGTKRYILARCLSGSIGMICNFYAIDRLNISDAAMLNKLSPFFAIIFSYFILKEIPKKYQVVCVIIAFIGALFILKPGANGFLSFPAFMGFIGGAGAGLAHTNVRKAATLGADKSIIIFIFSLFTCLTCAPFFIIQFAPMSAKQLTLLILGGLGATLGQFGITTAFAYGKASEISVYDYSIILFTAAFGMMFLNEVPDVFSIIGYCVIIGAGVAMFMITKKHAVEQ